jgi:hypothetical protein
MLKLQRSGHTVWAECWNYKEVGTLCGQNAEITKRWAHCVGRILKLQRGEHFVWAAGWSYKGVGTMCGHNAEVAKTWAHCVGRMLKLQRGGHCVGRGLKLHRGGHTVWAECWSYKDVGTLCGQNAEVAKRQTHRMGSRMKLRKGGHTGQNADVPKVSTLVLLIVIYCVVKSCSLATKCQCFGGP